MLQADFPQPRAAGIAATGISHDPQLLCLRVGLVAHVPPPSQNTVNGKLSCIMIDSHAHPSLVPSYIVDAIGNYLAQLLVGEIMNQRFLRFSLWLPFLATVAIIPHQFLFLRIYGNDREILG